METLINPNQINSKPIKILNVVQTRTLTRDGAVYSGFSQDNYLEFASIVNNGYINFSAYDIISKIASADSWKIRAKFKTGEVDNNIVQTILGQKFGNHNTPQISIYSGKINICISFTGDSWSFDEVFDSMVMSENTEYYIDLEFSGTAYIVTLYDASKTIIATETVGTSISKIYNAGQFKIGADSSAEGFAGAIDIESWEIEIDGQVWWKGVETL